MWRRVVHLTPLLEVVSSGVYITIHHFEHWIKCGQSGAEIILHHVHFLWFRAQKVLKCVAYGPFEQKKKILNPAETFFKKNFFFVWFHFWFHFYRIPHQKLVYITPRTFYLWFRAQKVLKCVVYGLFEQKKKFKSCRNIFQKKKFLIHFYFIFIEFSIKNWSRESKQKLKMNFC